MENPTRLNVIEELEHFPEKRKQFVDEIMNHLQSRLHKESLKHEQVC